MRILNRRCAVLIAAHLWLLALTPATHGAASDAPTLEILSPRDSRSDTTKPVGYILGKTQADKNVEVRVNGEAVTVFGTGLFVRDSIPLTLGTNTIEIEAKNKDGKVARETLTIVRAAETPAAPTPRLPLFIDDKSIKPADNVAVRQGDILETEFRGAPGHRAEYQIADGAWWPMTETVDAASTYPTGIYRGALKLDGRVPVTEDESASQPLKFRLSAVLDKDEREATSASASLDATSKARVAIWQQGGPPRMLRVRADKTGYLSFGLTEVRLGGPYLAQLTSGTLLQGIGRSGFQWKVELAPDQVGWISASDVDALPSGTAPPHLEFTDVQVSSTLSGDEMVIIPYKSPVPFSVRDLVSESPDGSPRIVADFYGAHVATTWISHRSEGKLVRQVTMDQVGDNHLRVTAHLAGRRLWGYKTEVTTGAVIVTVRKAPNLQSEPLRGLTIAVEAGHGGDNAGARGRAGGQEKNVTRQVADALEKELSAAGVKVVQTRIGDESVGLLARAGRAMNANADLFVSIHCNSAGSDRGFLAVKGHSTYYKHPYNHELAKLIHDRIRKLTDLPTFGVVGNFNYAPIRELTWMPAVLVEQAFISNPEEEALLLDPSFQRTMARGIREGLEEYLRTTQSD